MEPYLPCRSGGTRSACRWLPQIVSGLFHACICSQPVFPPLTFLGMSRNFKYRSVEPLRMFRCEHTLRLVIEPLIEGVHFVLGVRWKQVIDSYVGRRDENRFCVCERIVTVLPVVVPQTRGSHSPVRHGLNEEKDIGLVHGAAAKGKGLQHMIYGLLVSAKYVTGEGLWQGLDLVEQLSEVGVSEDWQKRSEDFVFHDLVGPGNRVQDARVEIMRRGIGLSAIDHLLAINQRRKPFDS